MNPGIYFLFFLVFLMYFRKRKITKSATLDQIKKGNHIMKDAAARYIGKDCIVELITDKQVTGIIQEVTEHAVIVKDIEHPDREPSAVNLSYVVNIRPFPYNKKGKRCSFY